MFLSISEYRGKWMAYLFVHLASITKSINSQTISILYLHSDIINLTLRYPYCVL